MTTHPGSDVSRTTLLSDMHSGRDEAFRCLRQNGDGKRHMLTRKGRRARLSIRPGRKIIILHRSPSCDALEIYDIHWTKNFQTCNPRKMWSCQKQKNDRGAQNIVLRRVRQRHVLFSLVHQKKKRSTEKKKTTEQMLGFISVITKSPEKKKTEEKMRTQKMSLLMPWISAKCRVCSLPWVHAGNVRRSTRTIPWAR